MNSVNWPVLLIVLSPVILGLLSMVAEELLYWHRANWRTKERRRYQQARADIDAIIASTQAQIRRHKR